MATEANYDVAAVKVSPLPSAAPAFQVYPGDWLKHVGFLRMAHEAQGLLFLLLMYDWANGCIPAQASEAAEILPRSWSTEEVERLWPEVRVFFVPVGDGAVVTYPGLAAQREKHAELREKRARAGREGGRAPRKSASADSEADAKQVLSDSEALDEHTEDSRQKREAQNGQGAAPAASQPAAQLGLDRVDGNPRNWD